MATSDTNKKFKYKKEYPEMLITHFRNGGSISGFSAVVRVTRETLYAWMREIPEFAEAYEIAKGEYQRRLETILAAKVTGSDVKLGDDKVLKIKNADLTAVIFSLKTRCHHDYGNKDKIELSGNIGTQRLDNLSDEQLEQRLALLKKANGTSQ